MPLSWVPWLLLPSWRPSLCSSFFLGLGHTARCQVRAFGLVPALFAVVNTCGTGNLSFTKAAVQRIKGYLVLFDIEQCAEFANDLHAGGSRSIVFQGKLNLSSG